MIRFFFMLFVSLFAVNNNATNASFPVSVVEDDPTLSVTQMSPTSALMVWTPFGSPGQQYTVKVTDLTAGRLITQFNTNNTSASTSGLVGGHLVRFEVSKAADGLPPFEIIVEF